MKRLLFLCALTINISNLQASSSVHAEKSGDKNLEEQFSKQELKELKELDLRSSLKKQRIKTYLKAAHVVDNVAVSPKSNRIKKSFIGLLLAHAKNQEKSDSETDSDSEFELKSLSLTGLSTISCRGVEKLAERTAKHFDKHGILFKSQKIRTLPHQHLFNCPSEQPELQENASASTQTSPAPQVNAAASSASSAAASAPASSKEALDDLGSIVASSRGKGQTTSGSAKGALYD